MRVTIEIPIELVERIESSNTRPNEIIERGLRESATALSPLAREVVDFLARGPQPEAIIAFRPSDASVARSCELLEKNRADPLQPDERAELEEMSRLNQLFALIKAQARQHLRRAS